MATIDTEAVRKVLSGMYASAFNVAEATDNPRAMTAAGRGLNRLNRLGFDPEPPEAANPHYEVSVVYE